MNNVSLKDFLIGLLAILPGTYLYCSLGSLAGNISRFNDCLDFTTKDKLTISRDNPFFRTQPLPQSPQVTTYQVCSNCSVLSKLKDKLSI